MASSDNNQVEIISEKCIDAVLAAMTEHQGTIMTEHDTHFGVQERGCLLLYSLTEIRATIALMVNQGALLVTVVHAAAKRFVSRGQARNSLLRAAGSSEKRSAD